MTSDPTAKLNKMIFAVEINRLTRVIYQFRATFYQNSHKTPRQRLKLHCLPCGFMMVSTAKGKFMCFAVVLDLRK